MTFNNILKFKVINLYYVLFILIPFSQSIPIFSIAGREVNIGMHTILIVLIVMVALISRSFNFSFIKEPATINLFLLSIWSFLTIVVSLRFAPASALANSFITWLRWVQFVPIVFFIYYGVGRESNYKKILTILLYISLFISIWGIYEAVFPSDFAATYFRGAVTFTKPIFRENELYQIIDPETGYYIGSANYNIAGTFMAMAVMMLIPFIFNNNNQSMEKRSNLISIATTIILISGIVVTQSRNALLGFFIALLFSNLKFNVKRLLSILIGIALLIFIFAAFLSKTGFGSMILETIVFLPRAIPMVLETQDYTESMGFSINVFGAAKRVLTILDAFKTFIESPVVGCGFFGYSFHSPHFGTAENFFAQMLAETGAIGGLLLISFLAFVWKHTRTNFMAGTFAYKFQRGFRGAFIVAIFANLTGTLFYDQRIWGLFLFLCAIQIRLVRDELSRLRSIEQA